MPVSDRSPMPAPVVPSLPHLFASPWSGPDGRSLQDSLARGWWHLMVPRTVVAPDVLDDAGRSAQSAWHEALRVLEHDLAALGPDRPEEVRHAQDLRDRWTAVATCIVRWRTTVLAPLIDPEDPANAARRAAVVLPEGSPWYAQGWTMWYGLTGEALEVLGRSLLRAHPKTLAPAELAGPSIEVLQAQQDLLRTYGLRSFAMAQTLADPEVQRQRIRTLAAALGNACEHLGIAASTWGQVAPHLIVRSASSLDESDAGGLYDSDLTTLHVLSARADTRLMMHEWTHALDHWSLQRHAHPGISNDQTLSSWLSRTTLGTRQAMDLPPGLQRSLAAVGRLIEELRGEQAPLLESNPLRRVVQQAAARLVAHRAQRADQQDRDRRLDEARLDATLQGSTSGTDPQPGPVAEPPEYWQAPHERLAHLVQHHDQSGVDVRMRIRHAQRLPLVPLDGSMRLVHAWIDAEGLRAVPGRPQAIPAASVLRLPDGLSASISGSVTTPPQAVPIAPTWSGGAAVNADDGPADPALVALAERFGLRTVLAPVTGEGTAVLQRRVARAARLLDRACAQLGIAPDAWGRAAPLLRLVDRLEHLDPQGRVQGAYGRYSSAEQGITVAVGVETDGPDLLGEARDARRVTTLVHEWVHALDYHAVARHGLATVGDVPLSVYALRSRAQQDPEAPDSLVRSASLILRILHELSGEQPPMLADGPWARWRGWHAARQWKRVAMTQDSRDGQAYYARGTEMLARAVQFHARDGKGFDEGLRMGLRLGLLAVPHMPGVPLTGTVALIRAWMAHEGMGPVTSLVPATPGPVVAVRHEGSADSLARPGRRPSP